MSLRIEALLIPRGRDPGRAPPLGCDEGTREQVREATEGIGAIALLRSIAIGLDYQYPTRGNALGPQMYHPCLGTCVKRARRKYVKTKTSGRGNFVDILPSRTRGVHRPDRRFVKAGIQDS
jgi:hypothetical protein